MGNCLNAASKRSRDMLPEEEEESLSEMRRISQLLLLQEEDEDDAAAEEAAAAAAAEAEEGLKVKIVLTRGELEWLMARLKAGGDGHRLRDLLHHMHAAKPRQEDYCSPKAAAAWRPCLESILECPENAAC